MYRPTLEEIEALNALGLSEKLGDYPVTMARLATLLAVMLRDQYPTVDLLTEPDKAKR